MNHADLLNRLKQIHAELVASPTNDEIAAGYLAGSGNICGCALCDLIAELSIAAETESRSEAGRALGKATGGKKAAAARENGRKGGRPRKIDAPT